MAEKSPDVQVDGTSASANTSHHGHHIVPIEQEAVEGAVHIDLSWRSWVVVAVCCFAVLAQVYVVVAAGSVLSFIIRDLGEPGLAGWVIQGPLLIQAVMSPLFGRLSDVLDRKLFAVVPPLIACVGAIVCAKATSMNMLIGGGILIGVTLASISIVQSVPSEVLPLKYRAIANGLAGATATVGGIAAGLSSGAAANSGLSGWRNIFWIQLALHGFTAFGLMFFYWPKKRSEYERMKAKDWIWACDPIGSFLLIVAATLLLLALNWGGSTYKWSDPHVYANLTVGLISLVAFCLYEWKGRTDGMVAHVFFSTGPNFWLSTAAFTIEGWIFYGAVNAVTPQIILHLGFEDNPWSISLRQLSFQLTVILTAAVVSWYSTRFKDLKTPVVVTFAIMFVVSVCYACIKPTWDSPQIVFAVLVGIGCGGPLTLLVACVQFTAPHAYLSTATGLAFSARAIGGAFGTAAIYAVVNSRIASHYAGDVAGAAIAAGLPPSSVGALLKSMAEATATTAKGQGIPGANEAIMQAAWNASYWSWAKAYQLGWWTVVPFVALATIATACMKGVRELMTEKVEATVEVEGAADTMLEKGKE